MLAIAIRRRGRDHGGLPTVDPAELMRRLDALPAAATLRAAVARYAGDVYLVGGAVRDLARGEAPERA